MENEHDLFLCEIFYFGLNEIKEHAHLYRIDCLVNLWVQPAK